MSPSIALRRSPKPGAFTATEVKVPRILFTTSVASASPSTSSAMISSGAPGLHDLLEHGHEVVHRGDLRVDDQDVGVLEDRLLALGVGHEVRREVALVELHALGELELEAEGVRLLDGDRAVLADLVDGVGEHFADGGVGRGDRRDLGDLLPAVDLLGLLGDGGDDRGARPARCRASATSGWHRRRRCAGPRGRAPGRARSRSSCRHRRRRWSWSRPRARAGRPCSRRGRRARSPGRS